MIATIGEGSGAAARSCGSSAPEPTDPPAPAAAKGGDISDEQAQALASRRRSAARCRRAASIPPASRASGKDGRLTKEDVAKAKAAARRPPPAPAAAPAQAAAPAAPKGERSEERVKMTRLRQTIATRLKDAQNTAALLTTFNDVDMTEVIAARTRYKDLFEKKHGIRLGFMGFFTKAVALAARDVPSVNARIEGDEIVYHNYLDVSVAVSAPKGLVVPVVRSADQMSFAEIEQAIAGFGKKAKDGTLTDDDMKGGTFTISNGGVFGSLLSTPIINPPQSGGARPPPDRGTRRGQGRPDRRAPDDVSRAVLRPPPDRRARGGDLPGARQGSDRGSDPPADRPVSVVPGEVEPYIREVLALAGTTRMIWLTTTTTFW